MPSLLYPESAWPVRFGRFVRALQMVAIAATVGAVGGGAAVLAVMGSGPPHKPAIVGADSDNGVKAFTVTKAIGDVKGSPPGSSAAGATAPGPAARSPAAAAPPPASNTPQPSQLAAAAAEPAAATPQNNRPAAAPAAPEASNHAKSTAHSVHLRIAKLRARENRRQRSAVAHYAREHDWHNYDSYRPSERDAAERGIGNGPFQRRIETGAIQRSYPYYDSAPRTGYWGGGPMFGGNWGN
jgi:hypothetical protein